MTKSTLSSAFEKSESSWRNALLFGNKAYFDELAEELNALNEFGAATGTGAIGSLVIAETFRRQRLSPIDAGLLINHASYDLFLGDALAIMGTSSAILGYDTSKPVLVASEADAKGALAGIVAGEAVRLAGKGINRAGSAEADESEENDVPMSFKDEKGREWMSLEAIDEAIEDVCYLVFKREDLATSLKVILQQESPRRPVNGRIYVQTNAVGPKNGGYPRGLYQFKKEAWVEAGRVKVRSGQTVADIIGDYDNAFDARTNIIASAALIIRNEQIAKAPRVRMVDYLPRGKSLSDPAVAYLMHNQGVGGAKKLLIAGPSAVASQLKYESVAARSLISTIFEGV